MWLCVVLLQLLLGPAVALHWFPAGGLQVVWRVGRPGHELHHPRGWAMVTGTWHHLEIYGLDLLLPFCCWSFLDLLDREKTTKKVRLVQLQPLDWCSSLGEICAVTTELEQNGLTTRKTESRWKATLTSSLACGAEVVDWGSGLQSDRTSTSSTLQVESKGPGQTTSVMVLSDCCCKMSGCIVSSITDWKLYFMKMAIVAGLVITLLY